MRSVFYSLLGYFLTPGGLVLLAALDSSLIFFLPLGIDFAIVILSAREPDRFWLYPLVATVGSLAGTALTFWIGRKVGEHGLSKLLSPSRLRRVQDRVGHSAAVSVAALGAIPPPFPFTAFVLTTGATRVRAWPFFATLTAVRLLRFGAEGWLASRYGRQIISWMESPVFKGIIGVLIFLAVTGTIVSAIALWKSAHRRSDEERHPHTPDTTTMASQRRKRSSAATPP